MRGVGHWEMGNKNGLEFCGHVLLVVNLVISKLSPCIGYYGKCFT